jgi:hypothetical protein
MQLTLVEIDNKIYLYLLKPFIFYLFWIMVNGRINSYYFIDILLNKSIIKFSLYFKTLLILYYV